MNGIANRLIKEAFGQKGYLIANSWKKAWSIEEKVNAGEMYVQVCSKNANPNFIWLESSKRTRSQNWSMAHVLYVHNSPTVQTPIALKMEVI